MQATPSSSALRALEVVLDKIFQRIYVGLDVDEEGIARIRQLSKGGSLILLPSHKSYIDFLVVSYVFYKANIPVPLIVAGENLSFFPMGPIARRAGAFFIRRTFRGDRLYAALVDAYVRRLFRDGFSFEVFLEGQRSRTGKLLAPKFGLLSMLVSAALTRDPAKVHFVPISIGYERIIETGSHQHEILGERKIKEDAAGLLSATEVLRHRYGRISCRLASRSTSSGGRRTADPVGRHRAHTPSSLACWSPTWATQRLTRIGRSMAVSPGALTALALLSHHRREHRAPQNADLCNSSRSPISSATRSHPGSAIARWRWAFAIGAGQRSADRLHADTHGSGAVADRCDAQPGPRHQRGAGTTVSEPVPLSARRAGCGGLGCGAAGADTDEAALLRSQPDGRLRSAALLRARQQRAGSWSSRAGCSTRAARWWPSWAASST